MVYDRVSHITHLGARGPAVMLHGIQHLGGHDYRLGRGVGRVNNFLLHQRHFGRRHFQPQIAPGHHNTVGRGQNFF